MEHASDTLRFHDLTAREAIMTGTSDHADRGGALDIQPEDVLTNISDAHLKTGRKTGSLKVPLGEATDALSQRNEGSASAIDAEENEERGPNPPFREQP